MSTSSTPLRVAIIGLPPDNHRVLPEFKDRLAKSLEAVHTQMTEAGIQYEFDSATPEEGLAALGQQLQSQRPDVVVIGNGIRRNMELTHFLEQIVDVVRTSAPQAKLAFNVMPDDSLDAVKRWFPNAAKSA